MGAFELDYDHLPVPVKRNLSAEQWEEARRVVVATGQPIPETTDYMNLKNGQCLRYQRGEPAPGPLLATHDLAGGGGNDSSQFHTEPAGARADHRDDDVQRDSGRTVASLKGRVEADMPVVCSDQAQLGVVDHLDQGNSIKLTKDRTGQHHWISMDWVTRVDAAVYLDRSLEQARHDWSMEPFRTIRREGPLSDTAEV